MTRRTLLLSSISLAAAQREDWNGALKLIETQISSGSLTAASLHVRHGKAELKRSFGEARTPEAVFLLASITKPMTSTAVMILSDRKQLSISEPVQKYIPEFHGGERDRVLIKHLLSHTSGLPDMLPENIELRKRHAPLKDFLAATYKTPLLFSPGSRQQYQSMGILLAAEIVERITRRPLSDFLRDGLFQKLGMKSKSLGLGGRPVTATMPSQVSDDTSWNWSSAYWRNLASPWGGAHATASDVTTFLRSFVDSKPRVLKFETAALMIADQNAGLNQPYGLGWALSGSKFGAGCSPRTFGHSGSTGTLCWLDPEKDLSFVLLTSKPAEFSQKTLLKPVSDIVSSSPRKGSSSGTI